MTSRHIKTTLFFPILAKTGIPIDEKYTYFSDNNVSNPSPSLSSNTDQVKPSAETHRHAP